MKQVKIKNSNETYIIGKIICVGRNYREHAEELGNVVPEFPLIFLKPTSALIYSGDKIVHPTFSENLNYEAELVLLIGEDLKNVDLTTAENGIAGYGVGLDMTLRDIQSEEIRKGHPWTVSKGFDTSAVISEINLKKDHPLNFDEKITLKLNGVIKQNCELNKMIFKPADIVRYISSVLVLEKGDLIFTGTPSGVGRVVKGDKLEAEITHIAKVEAEVI
ncbi:MAG: fumarylacetoacetate hydrolase family protein [Ignavibacteriales bacterium]|nr:fumarylacetoacetate hydrolase family protein [Ignavibacteriales bacterium]